MKTEVHITEVNGTMKLFIPELGIQIFGNDKRLNFIDHTNGELLSFRVSYKDSDELIHGLEKLLVPE